MKTYFMALVCLSMMACAKQSTIDNKAKSDTTATEAPSDANQASTNSVSLAELFANKEQYNGKTVQVSGKIVKVNKMIMNRNWVHIQDGTLKDKTMDLTVTTQEDMAVDQEVSMEGVISIDKDFGSGYKYAILMEDARLIK